VIVFVTTADTEILAAERARATLPAGFPPLRSANPARIAEPEAFVAEVAAVARLVVVRLLGGRDGWREGFPILEEACRARGIPLLALGGEAAPDADLAAASTVPPEVGARAFEYLRQGGVENTANLLRFLADAVLGERFGFAPPVRVPETGTYRPELAASHDPARPTVGVVFYRAHLLSGNTGFVDALAEALEAEGVNPLPVFCYSLRPDERGRVAASELLAGRADALVVTVLAAGGSCAADAFAGAGTDRPEGWLDWSAPALEALDVPILQAVCSTGSREEWIASAGGLSPLDVAMQVSIPEFDGRIITVPLSFKEPLGPGSDALAYRADPERARRVAGIAARLARLRRTPPAERRVAIVLSSYPTRNARVGNAVGLDTPASLVRLLGAMRDAGYAVDGFPDDADALVHELIAAGGYDQEFLTEDQLARAAARIGADEYAAWFEELPAELRERVRAHWGEPPGDLYVHDGRIAVTGLRFGNVFLTIQPPRGFGERPAAIYHDPDLPPSHHYLAAYRWIERGLGAHAVVHLGKHGTLEWLPGKGIGLSASCAPDAVLGSMPLVYPFIVNDPGEGTQAKRRAHAVIVDHLVPPMMRAGTYDDLARLEQLLDEYAEIQALDPAKVPAARARIWELVRRAQLHRDLGVADQLPSLDSFDELVVRLDGYLCELKDREVRGGLHVLGRTPQGEERIGLLLAMLRLGSGGAPGLRRAVARAFGLDEAALLADPGRPARAPAALTERAPGPAATGADLIDRLEELARALLERMEERGWDPDAARVACREVLGVEEEGVVACLELAAREVVPRLERTPEEIANVLRGLDGRFVPAGPSGSPTRGLLDVLPTGRNFYSVDPKAIPSPLAWETGQRLAEELLRRYVAEEGSYPDAVGIVVWGTSAMRTQGDDVAEILALLGVRPVWDEESRRVVGLEAIPLAELGRPRIDVTVRISGFFRDAFLNLVLLIDDAIRMVAALEEPDDRNLVARHVRRDLARGLEERRATTRIFGSKPGAYGAGLLPLIDARNWRTDADLARVYEVWGGHAYGRGLDGAPALEAMREGFGRVRVAVKNVDTREHDLLDSDDYFQYHGGMVAMVRALTGTSPRAYVADSSDPGNVRTRDLADEIRRVVRARAVNPRWIAAMARHGYKGAFELAATVDYLFGYDATTRLVEDWAYEAIAERYVLDPATAAFVRRSNPWALRAMAERLLEAAERGLWSEPRPGTLERLRAVYLEVEGDLEDAPAETREGVVR
jgi:cobaltochelatase CobN